MQSNYFLSMKSARAAIIRARLNTLKEQTREAYHQAQEETRAARFIGGELASFSEVETEYTRAQEEVTHLWTRIESLSFRLSMVQEPVCTFCGGTWGVITRDRHAFWCHTSGSNTGGLFLVLWLLLCPRALRGLFQPS